MWGVPRSSTWITVQILKHCKWMEQQATLCFLLKVNTKGHKTLGCSRAMNSWQSLINNCSLTVFSHAISINWWLAGNLPGALSHPFNQSYQISLEMIILLPHLSGLFLALIFLGTLARVILSNKQSKIRLFQINIFDFVTRDCKVRGWLLDGIYKHFLKMFCFEVFHWS